MDRWFSQLDAKSLVGNTQSDKLKRYCARIVFACFGVLATLDVVMLLSSGEYRDVLGVTHGVSDIFNIGRIVIDGSMIVFYGLVYLKMRDGSVLSRLMVWHGLLYGLLGVTLCIPWGGFLLAPLTPVGLLYLGALLWTPLSYPGALGVAGAFIVFNIYLVWAGLTSVTSNVSRPRVS